MTDEQAQPVQPTEPAPTSAPGPDTSNQKKPSAVLGITAIALAAVAVVLAMLPYVFFASPLFGIAALVLSIIALVKKSGPMAVRIVALVLSLLAAPLAAVGAVNTFNSMFTILNGKEVAAGVEAGILEQTGVPVTVACEDNLIGGIDSEFVCVVTAQSGNVGAVVVTLDAEKHVNWEVSDDAFFTILDRVLVEQEIADELWYDYNTYAMVSCPEEMIGGVDSTFVCVAENELGDTGEVLVTIDGGGKEDWYWEPIR